MAFGKRHIKTTFEISFTPVRMTKIKNDCEEMLA